MIILYIANIISLEHISSLHSSKLIKLGFCYVNQETIGRTQVVVLQLLIAAIELFDFDMFEEFHYKFLRYM